MTTSVSEDKQNKNITITVEHFETKESIHIQIDEFGNYKLWEGEAVPPNIVQTLHAGRNETVRFNELKINFKIEDAQIKYSIQKITVNGSIMWCYGSYFLRNLHE